MKLKLFIITVTDKYGADKEFCQFNESLAQIATVAQNLRFRIRAIEEIPYQTIPLPFSEFSKLTIGEADNYMIHGTHDEDVFKDQD